MYEDNTRGVGASVEAVHLPTIHSISKYYIHGTDYAWHNVVYLALVLPYRVVHDH